MVDLIHRLLFSFQSWIAKIEEPGLYMRYHACDSRESTRDLVEVVSLSID